MRCILLAVLQCTRASALFLYRTRLLHCERFATHPNQAGGQLHQSSLATLFSLYHMSNVSLVTALFRLAVDCLGPTTTTSVLLSERNRRLLSIYLQLTESLVEYSRTGKNSRCLCPLCLPWNTSSPIKSLPRLSTHLNQIRTLKIRPLESARGCVILFLASKQQSCEESTAATTTSPFGKVLLLRDYKRAVSPLTGLLVIRHASAWEN